MSSTSNSEASTSKSTRPPPTPSESNRVGGSSSLLSLKAEISRKSSERSSTTLTRGQPFSRGLTRRPGQVSSWQRSNKGVHDRNHRDRIVYEADIGEQGKRENARHKLEQKAALYDQIKKGKQAGLSEDKIGQLLVDFDAKQDEESSEDEQQGDWDEDPDYQAVDPLVEYTDDLGRTRLVRRSELPRGIPLPATEPYDDLPSTVHYGDQRSFPVYRPPQEVLDKLKAQRESEQGPLHDHFDASREIRTRGAGYMQFSKDEEERQRQMDALKEARQETVKMRKEEGEKGGIQGERERDKDERKRKLEDKRKEVEAKRLKRQQQTPAAAPPPS